MTDPWSRGFQIDSLAAACQFVETIWNEEHVPPMRVHGRGVDRFRPGDIRRHGEAVERYGLPSREQDPGGGSRLGTPDSSPLMNYVGANPNEVEAVTSTERGVHDTRWQYRYPLWRALSLLGRRDHDRWTRGVPRRPFHPTPVSVLRAMALDNFDPKRVHFRYADGTRVPADMGELFAIGAARKLRGVYAEGYVEWVGKSDAQQKAEDAT
jgi:hypothetical protein